MKRSLVLPTAPSGYLKKKSHFCLLCSSWEELLISIQEVVLWAKAHFLANCYWEDSHHLDKQEQIFEDGYSSPWHSTASVSATVFRASLVDAVPQRRVPSLPFIEHHTAAALRCQSTGFPLSLLAFQCIYTKQHKNWDISSHIYLHENMWPRRLTGRSNSSFVYLDL